MIKLIHAGIRRYLRSALFWFAVIATICNATWCGYYTGNSYFSCAYVVVEFIIYAILISWLTGRELNEGIFRNKVISGHTKTKIFFSEIILGFIACTMLFLIFAVIFCCLNSYVFSFVYYSLIIKILFDVLLTNLCFAAILVSTSCLISPIAATTVVNILFVLVLVFTSEAMLTIINGIEPEYITEYEYRQELRYDLDGSAYSVDVPIPGTEYEVKNPNYVHTPFSEIYTVLYNVLPFGHIIDYTEFTEGWFGLEVKAELQKYDTEIIYYDADGINENLIYSIFVLIAICGAGVLCFRRKDIK